jgi:GTP-binding protein
MPVIKSAEFITSAVKYNQYPREPMPEIAFAGRSNVGKSSLINTLLRRKRLVKTSSTPGRTQLINFFEINGSFRFVDLPGYGYAKVPASVRKQWKPMVETYLSRREFLQGVVLLLDIRREPRREEFDLARWLDAYGIHRLFVVTKTDKITKNRQTGRRKDIARGLSMNPDHLILFSAKTRQGFEPLWTAIETMLTGHEAFSDTGNHDGVLLSNPT